MICAVNHETIIKIGENWELYSLKFFNPNCRLGIVNTNSFSSHFNWVPRSIARPIEAVRVL